jgi:hypothetical protein
MSGISFMSMAMVRLARRPLVAGVLIVSANGSVARGEGWRFVTAAIPRVSCSSLNIFILVAIAVLLLAGHVPVGKSGLAGLVGSG